MSFDNDLLHRGIENQHSPVYSFLHMSFFFLSTFLVKDISTTILDRKFIFGIQKNSDKLYFGIETQLSFIIPWL